MQTLVERRYIFKRRSNKSRVMLAVAASAAAMAALSAQVAHADFGGYQRMISIAEPPK